MDSHSTLAFVCLLHGSCLNLTSILVQYVSNRELPSVAMSSNVSLCPSGTPAPVTEDLKNIRWRLISLRNSRLVSVAIFGAHDEGGKRDEHFVGSLSVEAESCFVSCYAAQDYLNTRRHSTCESLSCYKVSK